MAKSRLSESVVIFVYRLFCISTALRLRAEGNAMESNSSKNRKSRYNTDRSHYLTSDSRYYCYTYWSDKEKCMVTERYEVGKDISVEITIELDKLDHDMDLNDRYENELKDSLFESKVNSYKGKVFAVDPPTFVELEVTETDPGFKGDTATNVTKPATVETGAELKVPLFINPGDRIKIDTRTGEYLERAKG